MKISNHRSKSWTQALSCFDLMPVLARNTSTYLHVASCVLAFANIVLLFIFNNLLALNIQHKWLPQTRTKHGESRVLEKTWENTTTCRCEAIPLLWDANPWNALVWSAVSKTLLEDCMMWQFCTTLLWDTLGIEDSCETLLRDTKLQDALLTHGGTIDKQWPKRYSKWWPNNTTFCCSSTTGMSR